MQTAAGLRSPGHADGTTIGAPPVREGPGAPTGLTAFTGALHPGSVAAYAAFFMMGELVKCRPGRDLSTIPRDCWKR